MLFLRGLRWRRGFSAAVLVVGIISAAVAAIGPLYARAASESTLTDELRDAGSRAGMAFSIADYPVDPDPAAKVDRIVGHGVNVAGYGRPIHGQSVVITAKIPTASATTPSTMVWRSGQCAHVVIVTGRCPSGPGEAMVPESTRQSAPNWTVGRSLIVYQSILTVQGIIDGPQLGSVRVVGSYRARNTAEAYWFDLHYFVSQYGPAVSSAIKGDVDAIFVDAKQFTRAPPNTPTEVDLDVPLVVGHVRLADVAALRRNVARVQGEFPSGHFGPDLPQMRTDLPAVLADAARDKRQVESATLVVVLELAALSLLVLFQVVGGAVESRGDEIALAKLRGLPPWRTVAFALGEPVSLLVLAAPLGLVVAFGVTQALASSALVGGTPVTLTATTGWALAVAFTGSAVAAVLAAAKTVTRPVLEQWRNTSPPRHGTRLLLALDLLLAALAVATVILLRAGSSDRPRAVFLLAPALIVFAVALVGVRLLPRLGRLGLGRTRSSSNIASFLALRQTVRRPGGLRLAALLAVAAGLAIFAICGEAVAAGNRHARAQTELGAAQQVSVQFETRHDPQTAVEKADPHGKWAMATAAWSPDGGPPQSATVVGLLLGVQPSRLVSTTYSVRGQLSASALAAAITSPVSTPANFRGTRLRVTVTTTSLTGDHPTLEINVRHQHALAVGMPAGPVRLGTHQYTVAVPCTDGCAFTGLTFDRTIDAQNRVTGVAKLTAVEADDGVRFTPVQLRLGDPTAWRPAEIGYNASQLITTSADGVTSMFRSTDGASPVLAYADSPTSLPIAATPKSVTERAREGGVIDYTGVTANYTVRSWASPLPAMLDTGAIGNLDYLRISLPNFDKESAWTVWLGPHAPHDAIARLERAGLLVQSVRTEGARVAELGRQGPALGLLLLLVCAIAAAVLAVGGTAVALLADARRRSFELAALRVVGVPHKTLRRSAVVEQALLLGAAVVLGLPSGYVAAALVLPVVPEFADPTPVVLRYSPPILLALGCAAAFATLLWVTSLVAGRALARAAVPARLREAAR